MAVTISPSDEGKYIAKYQFKFCMEFRELALNPHMQGYILKYFAK